MFLFIRLVFFQGDLEIVFELLLGLKSFYRLGLEQIEIYFDLIEGNIGNGVAG